MRTKMRIGSHPLHPMLNAFPVAFYTATVVALIAYAAGAGSFWFQVGFVANVAGVIMALAAAIPGFVDWAVAVPSDSPAKTTGLWHMAANVIALVCFAVAAFMNRSEWADPLPVLHSGALALTIIGLGFTLIAGWLGWKMVQDHHVGVDLSVDQERYEPKVTPAPARHGGPLPH
jgi:uncharacterized membrane protein